MQDTRNLQVKVRGSPVSTSTAWTVQSCRSLDQRAVVVRMPKRIFCRTPCSRAVSSMYFWMEGPSASVLRLCQGLKS
ncbi:hypothetical protein D3C80_1809650 [compost metagenome]